MVDADAPVDLVMKSDMSIRNVLIPRKLQAIHAEVGMPPSRPIGIFRVDLGEGDERAAVRGPRNEPRQLADGGFVSQNGAAGHKLGPQEPQGARYVAIAP